MLGMIPYAGFSFYTFEKLKYLCLKYAPHYLCSEHKTTGELNCPFPIDTRNINRLFLSNLP